MNKLNSEITLEAKGSLKENWGRAILFCFIYSIILSVSGYIPFITIFIYGPLLFGLYSFFLSLNRGQESDLKQLFSGFNLNNILTGILMQIYIILWSLLFIIPGIIASFSYSQVFFILVDEPDLEPKKALRKSKDMMRESKLKLFMLNCRFIGWFIFSLLTFGIGFLFLAPYYFSSLSLFYEDLKANYQSIEII